MPVASAAMKCFTPKSLNSVALTFCRISRTSDTRFCTPVPRSSSYTRLVARCTACSSVVRHVLRYCPHKPRSAPEASWQRFSCQFSPSLRTSALRARRLVERGAKAFRQLQRIVVGPEVQKKESWLLVQHVTVDCRHFDAICKKRLDYRVDLITRQHKIASDRRFAAAGRLEIDGLRY